MDLSKPDGCHDFVSIIMIFCINYCIINIIGLVTGPCHVSCRIRGTKTWRSWLSEDGDTIQRSSAKLEAILGPDLEGKRLSKFMVNSEPLRLQDVIEAGQVCGWPLHGAMSHSLNRQSKTIFKN